MRLVDFGNTGLKVTEVGLGGAQFGIYNESITIDDGSKVVRQAYDEGIRYFDTAPWYGYNSGQSEKTLGQGLRGLDRCSFVLATKVGRYEYDVMKQFDFSAEKTEASVKKSLELLETDYIDVIQVHDFEYAPDINQILTETLPALDRLRQRGLVRKIGLGTYSLAGAKYLIENSTVKIDTVLNHSCLTLIDQELRDYSEFLKKNGIGLVNASVLAHGLLIDREYPPFLRADAELMAASKRAIEMCRERKFSIEHLAYGYAAEEGRKEGVHVLLTGADTVPLLKANIAAVCDGLTKEELAMCEELRNEVFGKLKVRNWVQNDPAVFKERLKAAREGKVVSYYGGDN